MSNTQENKEKKEENSKSTVKKLENAQVEITGEIPTEEFEKFRAEAVKSFGEKAKVAGFRSGHIPENVIEGKFGEMAILEEMAQGALAKKYPELLQEHKIDAIGQPEIHITKIAKGSPLGFQIKTAVMPTIELPDYKKLSKENAGEEKKIEIQDKEVDDVITHLRNERKRMAEMKEAGEEKEEKGEVQKKEENDVKDTADKEKKVESEGRNPDEIGKLPPLTEEEIKELGFQNEDELKGAIRENLTREKEARQKDERRNKIIEALMKETKMEVPDVVVDNELERMMAQLKGEIANMGLEFDQYLEHVKKTEEDLRKASRPDAEKRAKSQLIINKIAVEEDIKPDKSEVEKEVKNLMEKYDDANEDRTRAYIEMVLTNEAVLKFLEGQ